MNPDREFADQLDQWLTEGPADAPDRVLESVIVAFPAIRQGRSATRVAWVLAHLRGHVRGLTALAAAAAVLIAGVVILVEPSPNVGAPSPAPPASPLPSPPASQVPSIAPGSIDTSAWSSYTSARYGFTVRYPTDWSVLPATEQWTSATALPSADLRGSSNPKLDTFASPVGPLFTAASMPLPTGTSAETWLAAFEAARAAADPTEAICWPAPGRMGRRTIQGIPAWVNGECVSTAVIAFVGGRAYVFTSEIDTTLNRPVFDAFLSTVTFAPSSANDSTGSSSPTAPPPS